MGISGLPSKTRDMREVFAYMPLSKVPRFCCIGAALFFNHSFYQGCVCFALNVSMASCTEQREERTLETPQYCCCVCIFLPLLHALRAAAASLLSGQHKALSDLAGHVCSGRMMILVG